MASDDPNYNSYHHSNVGCFGLFESIDDPAVAAALIEAATEWLRAKGRDEIMGPIDYSTNYVCGLLVEGFQYPPMILTAHNPPYYAALLEGLGLAKTMDFYAWWFDDPAESVRRLRRIATALKKKQSVTIRMGDLKDLRGESERLREVYNEAWKDNWGFVPFTEKEFAALTRELKQLVVPELTWIAEVHGEPVGFILCLPDIHVALKKINGRLTTWGLPIGLAKLLYYKSRIRTVRLIALGIKPGYRRGGIAEMLVLRIIEEAMLKRGYVGETSMILENNILMNRFLAAIGARKYKTYRIYRRPVDASLWEARAPAPPAGKSFH